MPPDVTQFNGIVPAQRSLPIYWSFDITGLNLTNAIIHFTVRDATGVLRHLRKRSDVTVDQANNRVRVQLNPDPDLKRLPLGPHQVQLAIVDFPGAGDQVGKVLRIYEFPALLVP